MNSTSIQKRAAANLARVRDAVEQKQFQDRAKALHKQIPSAVDTLLDMVKEYGIVNAAEIAFKNFGTAVDEKECRFWKLISDGLQAIKDRRGL